MEEYHAFLSYNSAHLKEAKIIYDYLSNSGLNVFFDKESIEYGKPFQNSIEQGIRKSKSFIIIIGYNGLGPWQEEESYTWQLLSMGKSEGGIFIPLFLPGASFQKEKDKLPLFLQRFHHIEFHDTLDNERLIFQLIKSLPNIESSGNSFERPLLNKEQNSLLSQTIDFYSNNSEQYYERWNDSLPLPALYAFLQSTRDTVRNPKILDAGCGPGHHSNFLSKEGCEVTGLDLSAKMLQIAKKTTKGSSKFIHGDMRDLQSTFGSRNLFDGVWACASCIHLARESIDLQLHEFTAILKPGGVLGIALQIDAPSLIQTDGRFFERYAETEVYSLLERHGYNIANVNTTISRRSMEDKRKVKKWINISAYAPNKKEVIAPYKH